MCTLYSVRCHFYSGILGLYLTEVLARNFLVIKSHYLALCSKLSVARQDQKWVSASKSAQQMGRRANALVLALALYGCSKVPIPPRTG